MMPSVFLVLIAAAAPAPETDILAQLQAGRMICSNPDQRTRSCTSIDSFRPFADGAFVDTGEVLLPGYDAMTLEVSSLVRVEDGALCGTIELEDMERGRVRVNGAPLPLERNVEVLRSIIERLRPLAGRKNCEILRIEAGRLMKYGQVEGIAIKPPGKPVAWITPELGYKVAPR